MLGRRGKSVAIIVATIGQYTTTLGRQYVPAIFGAGAITSTKEKVHTLGNCAAVHLMTSVVTLKFTSTNSSDIKVPLQYLLSSITAAFIG